MKKVLVLAGSHRKNGLGNKVLDVFKSNFSEAEFEFETVQLSHYRIEFCKGCIACFKRHESVCPCKDDVPMIVEKMLDADGIVFISPVYGMNISGQLKTFMDRITYTYHRPVFYGKPTVFIGSTDVGGVKLLSKYMKYIAEAMGMRWSGYIGALSGKYDRDETYRMNISEEMRTLANSFLNDLKFDERPNPRFSELLHFKKWQQKNRRVKEIYPEDFKYWSDNGWFESEYYYDVKISPVNRFRLKLVEKAVNRMMDRNM